MTSRSLSSRSALRWAVISLAVASSARPPPGRPRRLLEKPNICTGIGRPGLVDVLAGVIREAPDLGPGLARDDVVGHAEFAFRDQHGGQHAGALVEHGLDDDALGGTGIAGARSSSWATRSISSRSSCLPRLGGEVDRDGVAAVLLGMSSCCMRSCLTLSGLACGRSTLLMATTMGTPAALAWAMASRVCGMTESSAATTMTAMSVALAPRCRMVVEPRDPGYRGK